MLLYCDRYFEQLYSPQTDKEKNKQILIYNKHQNTISIQDYQAHAAYKINGK